ncbi:hypothetical protein Hanom_Chr07g00642961 [Helianthus anomalus]
MLLISGLHALKANTFEVRVWFEFIFYRRVPDVFIQGLMIGLSACSFTRGKTRADGTQESFITAVYHAQIFERVLVDERICANTLMVCLSIRRLAEQMQLDQLVA